MGDRYQPNDHYGGYNSYRPPPPWYSDRPRYDDYQRSSRSDHYRPYEADPRDRYRDPYPPPPPPPGAGYTFRGAADRNVPPPPPPPPMRPPQGDFTFDAQHSSAPRFPSSPQQAHPRPRRRDDARRGGRGRGGFAPRGRGGRPAHDRAILNRAGREPTPEMLGGMNNNGQERFVEVESSSEDDDKHSIVDLTNSDAGDERRNKRVKTEAAPPAEAPKWSNPDPYTALPPPESLGAPKKDIVQVIRKAKNDAAPKAESDNTTKQNADFISLNFDDDDDDQDMDDDDSVQENMPPSNAPKAPSGLSHRPSFHASLPSEPPPPPKTSSLPANGKRGPVARSAEGTDSPPSPPPGFVMPTDEELMDQYTGGGKGKKRKQINTKPPTAFDIVEEWEWTGGDSTPWCRVDHSRTANTGLRLHKEICDFYEFVRPYPYEEAVRRDLIKRVEQCARTAQIQHARDVRIECFGSFAAGLYLPTADMDLVAITPAFKSYGRRMFGQTGTSMHKLAKAMQFANVAAPAGVAVITRARVPIIKFADKLSGIKVDISFENDSGLLANRTFQRWKADFPAMPVIVVLVKQLLAMRGLNEVYTGGIGGFTIICLVVSMMQLMPELQSGSMDPTMHYGDLLLNFLDLYGNKFDIHTTGIMLDPPRYFDKENETRVNAKSDRLTIIDPNKRDNDISGGSHRINDVLDVFSHAHAELQRRLSQLHRGKGVQDSILGCIWGGNYSSFIHQREKLSLLQRGYRVSPPPPPAPQPVNQLPKKAKGGKDKSLENPNKKQKMAQSSQKEPQSFYGDRELSTAPAMKHPLPAKPAPQQAQQNGASTAPLQQSTDNNRDDKPPKSKKAKRRAKQFKAQFPQVRDVPNALSDTDLNELCAKNGIDPQEFDRSYGLVPA
ncbi:hypothetical protein KC346_g560 [Hortaea werneckii]|nr:hypothetical protein KC346_g560 [Hortaea werneckii]